MSPTTNPVPIKIPNGKTCFWSMITQAAYVQTLIIKDSAGNPVVNQSGQSVHPTLANHGSFVANTGDGHYTVEIQANGVNERVIYAENSNVFQGTICQQTWTFVSEDSTDNDFNDCFVILTWFNKTN